jgi:nucleoside-diphosphate-sugar epimerase/GT2 family glycosyltransferase
MKRRVLITGGAGFIGSHLVRACLREGWQVAVLYQPENGIAQIQEVLSQIDAYPVIGKSGEVIEIFRKFRPELVFHLASVFISDHKTEDVPTLIDANVAFGAQILESMAQHKTPYLINTGTSWQHFEDDEYNPVNLYAATKQAFEDILQYYVEATPLKAITLKLYDTYGPADPRPKLFNLLERTAQEKTQLKMSPGEQLIDIVYIDDVVDAFIAAAKRLFEGKVDRHEIYAISSGRPIQLRDLVNIYKAITGYELDLIWGGRPYRGREVMVPWTGGKHLPDWSPKISLEQGIKNCKGTQTNDDTGPTVTVCIPVYNCQEYIAQAIESVLAQTFSDFELLIVDNASTDETLDVIARYTDPRIRLIRNKKNIGVEANWNKAITEARGKYVKLLPADDFLYPSCLEQQVRIFESPENASVSLVTCARDIVDPGGKKIITRRFPGPERKIKSANAIRTLIHSGTNLLGEPGAILFKRTLLQKTGTFDGTIGYVIDVHLWLRILLYGNLYTLPVPYCAFRLSSGSASLELATLQSKHFAMFIDQFSADPRFGIHWIDRQQGILMSRLLGLARRLFYIFSVHE